jgi:hypothetical protein
LCIHSRLGASFGGLVRVLAVDVDHPVALAESRITRPMSDDECRQYLHLDRCERGSADCHGTATTLAQSCGSLRSP